MNIDEQLRTAAQNVVEHAVDTETHGDGLALVPVKDILALGRALGKLIAPGTRR